MAISLSRGPLGISFQGGILSVLFAVSPRSRFGELRAGCSGPGREAERCPGAQPSHHVCHRQRSSVHLIPKRVASLSQELSAVRRPPPGQTAPPVGRLRDRPLRLSAAGREPTYAFHALGRPVM